MTPRLIELLTRFIYYSDGKLHWRRISVLGLASLVVWAVDAYKPELLAAHWYGTAKNIGGGLLALVAAVVGRDVPPAPPVPPEATP